MPSSGLGAAGTGGCERGPGHHRGNDQAHGQAGDCNPGDRENSLYASVELSLRRLPPEMRELVQGLAVFHGGGNGFNMSAALGIEPKELAKPAAWLIKVGLAELREHGYIRLDPALSDFLRLGQSTERLAELEAAWAEAMSQLVSFLYEQMFKDCNLAATLTLLELPNLMALLDWLEQQINADPAKAEEISTVAQLTEKLLSDLNQPQALARAVELREKAANLISDWGRVCFEDEYSMIERLLDQGNMQIAFEYARSLLKKAQSAGPQAYENADYHLAMAHFLLGRVLNNVEQAAPALDFLIESQQLFEALGKLGKQMASTALVEQADCLSKLGRLDAAAEKYEEAIRRDEQQEDFRGVAIGKGQLATLRYDQQRYDHALAGYQEVLTIFERLGEPASISTIWHQIGMVHQKTGHSTKRLRPPIAVHWK
ncbi:hypothetical protein H206_05390 [Candidatus Electrothrix aarhusensis]|uniref:Uncharacterized protein n=1 Tax=Candidatus Electrothrix aarhusensis TaxID=1859131 RepID=A0A3S3QLU4_9BACT|nr:hypothetical protein H206_05390 [Candidatus Electrothrix aarhusensis]